VRLKTLLYLRGEPGTGKHTVAKLLEQRLGWKVFWLHDLDSLCVLFGTSKLARLMDDVTKAVLGHFFETGQNLIYVRPSRDRETVYRVLRLAERAGYRTVLVTLAADYETLRGRVEARVGSDWRVSTRAGLDEYLSRPATAPEGVVVQTGGKTAEEVADEVRGLL
jgi:predicted kinase